MIKQSIKVPNQLAADSSICGVFDNVDKEFIELIKSNKIKPKPLLVCSGGTSSGCAANKHWTLDLRNKYQNISFNPSSQEIEIEAGVKMKHLITELSKYQRSFPIGLSGETGIGYILTGGISPISRSRGLAIDQIQKIKGIWGSGEIFEISKPKESSSKEDKLKWRVLNGAAPFLAIVTSITLKTIPKNPLYICTAFISPEQLAESIYQAESWPNYASFQWIWGEHIKAYVVMEINKSQDQELYKKLLKKLPFENDSEISIVEGFSSIPTFNLPANKNLTYSKTHSEVVGLLGGPWNSHCKEVIKDLQCLINKRPHENCYIASQQLGGLTTSVKKHESSFIYRDSIWKPWINCSWPAGNIEKRKVSLLWLEEVWELLQAFCPGIHLAQMHPHLSWHKKEIKSAFFDWLPELQNLKSKYDPKGLLPPL